MALPSWLERLLQNLGLRFKEKRMSVLLSSDVQLGCMMAGPGRRISLTFDDHGARSSIDFEPASEADFIAYAAILALPRPRYFDEYSRAMMTTEMSVASEPTAPATVGSVQMVRELEAWWREGEGGWILLRLKSMKRLLYRFSGTEALRFASVIATFENGPVFYIPDVGVVRGISETSAPPQWGVIP
jgi:hypothetical protein